MPGAFKDIAAKRAELIRELVEKHQFLYKGQDLSGVTVSLGVADYPEDGDNATALMRAADKALYLAKDEGRNRVVLAR